MTPIPEKPLMADSPSFAKLRPDVREKIRAAELAFRECMGELIDAFPDHMRESLQDLRSEIPANFLVGMLPFFKDLGAVMDYREMAEKRLKRERSGRVKPN